MDQSKLETSEDIVQESVKMVYDENKDDITADSSDAALYYLLSLFDNRLGKEFAETWIQGPEHYHTLALEHCDDLYYLTKIYDTYDLDPKFDEEIEKVRESILMEQKTNGRILNEHGYALLVLLQTTSPEKSSDNTQKAIEYLINERPAFPHSYAPGLIALLEHDYMEYKKEILEMGGELNDMVLEYYDSDMEMHKFSHIDFVARALKMIPDQEYEATEFISKEVKNLLRTAIDDEDEFKDKSFAYTQPILALISLGYGPKVSEINMSWEIERRKQESDRSKPIFTSTKPATRMERRKTGIYDRAKELIDNSTECLRISTLRMDMLHDNIIDKIEDNPEIDIKILTNSGSASGPRSKMKKAVMNEMVKRTDGNVREDELVHSRMLISDNSEVLISSADITRDQLYDEFNAGIYTKDPHVVQESIEFFEDIWQSADPRSVR